MKNFDIPYGKQTIGEEDLSAVADALRSDWLTTGPRVAEFETAFADFVGARHAVAVNSGTAALHTAMFGIGIGPGDEVIVPAMTFAASANCVVFQGGTPVFADVDPLTYNVTAETIARKITKRTRAIIVTHLFGNACDMDPILALAARHGLPVIEDAAQSYGASYKGRRSNNLSTIGCTSFFPSKPLGCYGDGGAIFTSDDALAQAAREIRVHGQSARYTHTRVGVGGRMDTLQCAIVLA